MSSALNNRRRGSASVALIVALVMLQILVAAMVLAGARQSDLTAVRLETARAFYAAEAGANMALRELMLELDEDGDGGVGSISDDGNAANDPALGQARLAASQSTAGALTTVTVTARAGQAARRLQLIVETQ